MDFRQEASVAGEQISHLKIINLNDMKTSAWLSSLKKGVKNLFQIFDNNK